MTRSATTAANAAELRPGFMVLQSNRLEDLRAVTLQWLAREPLGPMEDEYVLVQSNGVGQWLKTAMAQEPDDVTHGLGIAFGVQVMLPARFQWLAYRAVLEAADGGSLPETSLFDKSRLRWRLMTRIPALQARPGFEPLRAFLADDSATDQRRRWQLAERLADLYDQYQVYRADWLGAWADGDDVLIGADGERTALPDDQRWQALLWRDLEESVGEQHRASHRAATHARYLEAARTLTPATRPPDIPRRLLVFGISSLPRQTLEALAALAGVTQVIVCMVNPCRHYWGDIIEQRELLRMEYRRQARREGMPAEVDPALLHLHAQPLLAAWGRQGRDALHLVDAHDDTGSYAGRFGAAGLAIDLFAEPGEDTLLHQLQSDVLDLRPLPETRDLWPAVDARSDGSIRFHVAHGPQREVEILHDQLLAAFDADPTLRPGDVIVMVPDVNLFAPHVHAVFGQFEREDPRRIPYQVADQKQRHRAPLLVALEQLLSLPRLRLRVSEVMGLLEVPAIRARVGIDADELPTLHRWIGEANIRWGLDADHRADLGLPAQDAMHSWRFGLQRMLYGYAMGAIDPDVPLPDGVVPYPEVAGLDAELVGRLARFIDLLAAQRDALAGNHIPAEWVTRLSQLLASCFRASSDADDRLLGQLTETLEAWQGQCADAGFEEPLPLGVAAESWLDLIDEDGLSQRFGGGAVTFATLLPMRAVPFRQVCLLGMNDADYPRRASRPDFDLMALPAQIRPGDRSRREDDRYLFLEAVLAARDNLYVSWTGRSQRDNSEQPASVLVGQLRDHLAAGWRLEGSEELAKAGEHLLLALTTEHPLQPFGSDYFLRQEEHEHRHLGEAAGDTRRAGTTARASGIDGARPDAAAASPPEAETAPERAENTAPDAGLGAASGTDEQQRARSAERQAEQSARATARAQLFTYAEEWAALHAPAASNGRDAAVQGALAGSTSADPDEHTEAQAPLPPWTPDVPVTLRQLTDFLRNPIRELFRQRLRTWFPEEDVEDLDEEPFAISPGLERWVAQDALLQPVGRHLDLDAAIDPQARLEAVRTQLRLAGSYPSGEYGDLLSAEVAAPLEQALGEYARLRARFPDPVDPSPELALAVQVDGADTGADGDGDGDGDAHDRVRESGTRRALQLDDIVDHLWTNDRGDTTRLVLETSGALDASEKPQARVIVRHWPMHLALQCLHPGSTTVIVSPRGSVTIPGLEADEARALLEALLHAWHDGMRRPLPLTADLAFAILACLEAPVDDPEVDFSPLLAAAGVRRVFEQARKPGSAFAREVDSLEMLLSGPHRDAARAALLALYLPLLERVPELGKAALASGAANAEDSA